MQDISAWREIIIDIVSNLSDMEELRRAWSGNGGAGEVRSFNEDIAVLLDSFRLREFVALGPEKTGLSGPLYDALLRFDYAF